MNPGHPGDDFFEAFTPGVNERLVGALREAYESARESDQLLSDRGSCEQLFGTTVYHCAKREFKKALLSAEDIHLDSEYPLFRLAIGPYLVGFYRVGQFSSQDIWRSFPKNRNGAGRMVNDQMPLPFPVPEDHGMHDLSGARSVILAHFGNRDDGLTAAYLAIPIREENGEIVQWGFAHQLWADDLVAPAMQAAPQQPPPVEPEIEPTVRRKERKKEQ